MRLLLILTLLWNSFAAFQSACDKSNVCPASSATNPASVQWASNSTTSGTASTVAVTVSAVGSGHGLFVFCISVTSLCTTPTAAGETFLTATGTSGCQNYAGDDTQCWYTTNTVGGETSVSCNTGANSNIFCVVGEFTRPSGLSTPKDAGGNTETASGTSTTVSTSAATTNPNDFVIACFGSYGAGNNAISISGYTSPSGSIITNATAQAGCGYVVTSSTGTYSATGSYTSSMRCTGIIMAFKP